MDDRFLIKNSLKRAHDVPGFRKMLSKKTNKNDCQKTHVEEFFPKGTLPVGLREKQEGIVLVCQQKSRCKFKPDRKTYYTTLFDQIRGIPVYSAYRLKSESTDYKRWRRPNWQENKGILKNN